MHTVHFISGLPRSGSTLLSAILRQNPEFHAAISSPLAAMFAAQIRCMSHLEATQFVSNERRRRILRSMVDAYYADLDDKQVVFDTNRTWCALLPALVELFPDARVICCVRSPAWIVDSVERLVQRNALLAPRMFKGEEIGNVYTRFDSLLKSGILGTPMKNLRQAWFSEHASQLIAVRYDSLVANPNAVIGKLYEQLGLKPFKHDFENVEYEESEFDIRLNMPGLHKVSGRVEPRPRTTILPVELFKQNHIEFWNQEGQNPRGVTVL